MSGSAVENVTVPELRAEIEGAKQELAERRVHLDEAEEKLREAMHLGYFEEQSSLDIFIEKEELANRCALLESHVDALQQRLTDAQGRVADAQKQEQAEAYTEQIKLARDALRSGQGEYFGALDVAAGAGLKITNARAELATLRPRLQILNDQLGLGLDVRNLAASGVDPSHDIERFAACAISLCGAVLGRRPITSGKWQEFESRRAKARINET